jgi:ATP-binding cassette subfamily B protein
MTVESLHFDRNIIERYADQPAALPPELRRRVQEAWGGDPIQLYALADLDSTLRLARQWIVLGPRFVALVREDGDIQSFERSQVREVRETPGLSCSRLSLLGKPGEPALAELRYSCRQKRAVENIKFILQQAIDTGGDGGKAVEFQGSADELYAAGIAAPVKEAQAAFASRKLAVVWRLLGYLKPYRMRMALGMLAASMMTLSTLIPPYLTGRMIDGVIRPFENGALPLDAAAKAGWILLGGVAATYLMLEVFRWLRLWTMAIIGEQVACDLRDDLFEHLQKLSVSFYGRKQTGSIISRVTSDTDRLWDFIAFGVVELSLAFIELTGLAIMLMILDFQLGLLVMIPVPLMLYAIYRHGQKMHGLFLRAWRKWSNVTAVVSDTVPGMRVVKAFNQEQRESKRFTQANNESVKTFNEIHIVWTSFWPLLMLSLHAVILIAWAAALPRIVSANPTLTVGSFVSFLLYMTMLLKPVEIIGQMARMINRATSSAHRIFEILDTEPKIVDAAESIRLEPIQGRVTFENVIFAYEGTARQALRGVSFDVQPGEMIGLVGPSGAGKTTITQLIARFHDITGGKLLIDGVDIRDLDSGHYRRQVGMVLQDPYLFHGSVLENIRYGRPEASPAEVIEAARAANAHDFICKLPQGYDTVVGERGQTLSGGERQRVSIARALLTNPRILILDEATSSVDSETEHHIQEALDRLVAGRTVFAIAHRLSTLSRATRLFAIKDGRIVESGTHEELLADEKGLYRKLYDMQRQLRDAYAV